MFEGFSGIKVKHSNDVVVDLAEHLTLRQENSDTGMISLSFEVLEKVDDRLKKLSLDLLGATQGGSWGSPPSQPADVNIV